MKPIFTQQPNSAILENMWEHMQNAPVVPSIDPGAVDLHQLAGARELMVALVRQQPETSAQHKVWWQLRQIRVERMFSNEFQAYHDSIVNFSSVIIVDAMQAILIWDHASDYLEANANQLLPWGLLKNDPAAILLANYIQLILNHISKPEQQLATHLGIKNE
jgi:hypothetical protein